MKKRILNNAASAIGMVAGTGLVIVGLLTGTETSTEYELDSAYGGDAYTGIQNAAASTSRGVAFLSGSFDHLSSHLGIALALVGIAVICYFLTKLEFEDKTTPAVAAKTAGAQAATAAPAAPAGAQADLGQPAAKAKDCLAPEPPQAYDPIKAEDA